VHWIKQWLQFLKLSIGFFINFPNLNSALQKILQIEF
jgi:hypothetical protein